MWHQCIHFQHGSAWPDAISCLTVCKPKLRTYTVKIYEEIVNTAHCNIGKQVYLCILWALVLFCHVDESIY